MQLYVKLEGSFECAIVGQDGKYMWNIMEP